MEYDEGETKPESTRKFLIQQVHEQSSLCDVVVKMGYWEKKFHRCVLVTSPFFDHVLNDNFLEKQTGRLEISIGTPVTLETAIMFLYGQKPKFNEENIENIFHMAEFLLIPNLKSASISWLNTLTITEENCLRFLQLSSIYDFEIPECTRYIEEHLPEMLLNPQMVNLTKESVHLLFSDKRLSYVPMDDKLSFLLKWSDAKSDARKVDMHGLLININFCDVSEPFLQELRKTQYLAGFLKEQPSVVQSKYHRVLIMKGGRYDDSFWCLDLERDQWFRVDSKSFKEESSNYYKEMIGTFTSDSKSLIYFVDKSYTPYSILELDLTMDTCSKINIIECDKTFQLKRIDDLKFDKGMCVGSINETIKSKMKLEKMSEVSEEQQQSNMMYLTGCPPVNHVIAMRYMENDRSLWSDYIETSTLYIGHMDNGNDNLEMSPLLTFKRDEILQFLISQNVIAIIFKSRKHVSIYNLDERKLEKIEQPTEYNDKLAHFKNGFVVYNNKRCISFTRLDGPCIEKKYEVVEIPFDGNNFEYITYFFAVKCCTVIIG